MCNKFSIENRFKKLSQVARVCFWEADLANQRFLLAPEFDYLLEHWGIAGAFGREFTYEEFASHIPLAFRDHVLACYLESLQTGEDYEIEYPMQVPDGSLVWVHSSVMLQKDDEGRIVGAQGVLQDITSHKNANRNAEQRLRTNEKKLQEAQRLGKLGHWQVDISRGGFVLSESLALIFGLEGKELLPFEEFNELVHPEDLSKASLLFLQTLTGDESAEFDFRIQDALHHTQKYIRCVVRNRFDEWGKVLLSYGIMQDITYIKQTELELRNAKERAERSDRLKSVFVANMSHEIRTPLNSIVGFSSLLASKELDYDKKALYLKIIQSGSKQLMTLISDIIDISKIESGNMELRKEDFLLQSVLQDVYELNKGLAVEEEKQELQFVCNYAIDKPIMLYSDRSRLVQILSNLISNAFKFTRKGVVEFGCLAKSNITSGRVLFYVKDTGIGIAAEYLSVIFNRFRQEDEGSSRKYQGSGLGLAICRSLVEMLGGTIWVESEKGKGSCFYFDLPLEHTQAVGNTNVLETVSEILPTVLQNKQVLVVDDNKENHQYLDELLKEEGAKVVHCFKADVAIRMVQAQSFDYVLMDVQMPGMDGCEATSVIKKIAPNVPVVLQTAHALIGDRERLLACGANEYIAKPFSPMQLKQLLSQLNMRVE